VKDAMVLTGYDGCDEYDECDGCEGRDVSDGL